MVLEEVRVAEGVHGHELRAVLERDLHEALALAEVEHVLAAPRQDLLALAARVDEDGLARGEDPAGRPLRRVDAVAPEPELADDGHVERGRRREHAEVDARERRVPERVDVEAEGGPVEGEDAVGVHGEHVDLAAVELQVRRRLDGHGEPAEEQAPELRAHEGGPGLAELVHGAVPGREPAEHEDERHLLRRVPPQAAAQREKRRREQAERRPDEVDRVEDDDDEQRVQPRADAGRRGRGAVHGHRLRLFGGCLGQASRHRGRVQRLASESNMLEW